MTREVTYLTHASIMLVSLAVAIALDDASPVIAGISIGILLICARSPESRGQLINPANAVTLLRLGMMLLAIGWVVGFSQIIALVMLILVLCLDGVDGFIARKLNVESLLGADLDIESDAAFVALMSVYWYVGDELPWWILLSGSARYLFILILNLTGYRETQAPSMRWAREIAVVHFIALLLPFITGDALYTPVLAFTSGLILFSFTREYFLRVNSV